MHISNRFIICNIKVVIVKNIDHSITSSNISKIGKIGSRLQIALFFLFYGNFHLTSSHVRLFRTHPLHVYLMLPNVPTRPVY